VNKRQKDQNKASIGIVCFDRYQSMTWHSEPSTDLHLNEHSEVSKERDVLNTLMTHRSRAGGPPRPKSQSKPPSSKSQPKTLNHPPSSSSSRPHAPSSPTTTSASSFFVSPTDPAILELIHQSLRSTLDSPTFLPAVQHIKSLLYDRRWLEVFGNETLLPTYVGRWVPSRALCFRELLGSLSEVMEIFEGDDDGETRVIVSLGGGAGSELIAIAALIHAQAHRSSDNGKERACFSWTGADIGAWEPTLDLFSNALRSGWDLAEILSTTYTRGDLLSPSHADLSELLTRSSPNLITLLFTLTELLSQSRPRTISLLRHLTKHTPPGCLFLVADSASDLSSFEIGSEGRKWPVWMVLHAVLLGDGGGWETVGSEDSRWYRLPEGVGAGWPVKLENTRYWMRLYRRV